MIDDIMKKADERMKGAEEQLLSNFASVRTGRANAMILDRVKAEYYGTLTPINQMAAIKTPDAHTLVIEPSKQKHAISTLSPSNGVFLVLRLKRSTPILTRYAYRDEGRTYARSFIP